MNRPAEYPSLWSLATTITASRYISDDIGTVTLNDIQSGSCFAATIEEQVAGKCVLLATTSQLATTLALIELDGVVRRVLLFSPDLISHLPSIITDAGVDFIITDGTLNLTGAPLVMCHRRIVTHSRVRIHRNYHQTEWVLFTSGTTGRPKMVVHTLASLSGPIADGVQGAQAPTDAVWSTFYDIRRYGGLQILLRALIGGGSMVLSSSNENVGDFLIRLSYAKVTHISGTPSHWRRVLMNSLAAAIAPSYIRLSGEVADQDILDHLHSQFPESNIAHAFASTEAGVGFDVRDGKAGFPLEFMPHPNGNTDIEIKIENGTLHLRSSRSALRYLADLKLPESDRFIDTGDLIEQRGDRYYFMGRKEGVINVGGQKVYPEEVENIITRHPAVISARVWARKSPVTGAIVAADIVLRSQEQDWLNIRSELLDNCTQNLARYKVPVTWRNVDKIEMTVAGKVKRA
jgi:acyl-CoA synthetase (AMP-forming)/AMP-acid ligase II